MAEETREGDVYRTLLEKLEQARQALGGQVFDVLGRVQFEGRPLRELLVEAIRYDDMLEMRAKLDQVLAQAVDRTQLQDLLEERALAHDAMDASVTRSGDRRVISKRMLYVELDEGGITRHVHYAPYLDYRPLTDSDPELDSILDRPECAWLDRDMESKAQGYAVANVVPEHLKEVRDAKLALTDR